MGCKGHFAGWDESVVDVHEPIKPNGRGCSAVSLSRIRVKVETQGENSCRYYVDKREKERNLRCIIRRGSSLWAVTCQLANYALRLLLRLLAVSAKSKHNRRSGGSFFFSLAKKKKKTCTVTCFVYITARPSLPRHAVSRSLSANILTLNRCWYSRASQRWPGL